MRLLSHTPATSRTTTPQMGETWIRRYRETAPSPVKAGDTVAAGAENERLAKANRELKDALAKLIAFAGPRTAIVNECGDRIIDPHVLNARAVLVAVEAGL
jgi:hypothetical protein